MEKGGRWFRPGKSDHETLSSSASAARRQRDDRTYLLPHDTASMLMHRVLNTELSVRRFIVSFKAQYLAQHTI
jgi:hypothetical protein